MRKIFAVLMLSLFCLSILGCATGKSSDGYMKTNTEMKDSGMKDNSMHDNGMKSDTMKEDKM